MPKHISPKHQAARESLIADLSALLRSKGLTGSAAARRANVDERDFRSIMRLDRAVSLSKLADIGEALGFELEMKWRER